MDDLKSLRDARCRPPEPSPAARDIAQAALLAHAAGATRAPAKSRRFVPARMGLRVAAVGGLAVALAAGVTVAQNLGGVDRSGKPREVVPAGPVANAAQVALYTAADHAQSVPFTAPRTGQWSYTAQQYQSHDNPIAGQVETAMTPLKIRIDRSWTRADGKMEASYVHDKPETSPAGGASVQPPIGYRTVAALPRDPAGLLAWAHKAPMGIAGGPDADAFVLLNSLLNDNPVLPPAEEATIYRAPALPGRDIGREVAVGVRQGPYRTPWSVRRSEMQTQHYTPSDPPTHPAPGIFAHSALWCYRQSQSRVRHRRA